MSIQSEITRLENAKADIASAIAEKGVSVPNGTRLDGMADLVSSISTGVDTSDATARAGDILSGKTAYVNGSKVTGTIATQSKSSPTVSVGTNGLITAYAVYNVGHNASAVTKTGTKQLTTKGATTITPSTSNQTAVASGVYTTGAVTVKGDANLKAENIKKDVSIFGVTGTHEGASASDSYSAIPTQYTIVRASSDEIYNGVTCAKLTFVTDPEIVLPSNATTENTAFYWEHSTLSMNEQVKAIVPPATGFGGARLSDIVFYVDDSGGYVSYGMSLALGGSITVTPSTDLPDHCGWRELAVYVDGREISMRNYPSRSGSSIVVGDGTPSGGSSGGSDNKTFAKLVDGSITEITVEDLDGATTIKPYLFYKCDSLTSVNIPNSVTSIQSSAFSTCAVLTSVNIPNSVTSISASAFTTCTALTSVNIPNGVTILDQAVFYKCSALASITIPNSVTSIKSSAFGGCTSLLSITIPSSVTNIDKSALQIGTSTNKATITMLRTTPPTINSATFVASQLNKIIVPKGCGNTYKSATNWSTFASYIQEAT